MNSALLDRRIKLGLLIGTVLIAAGVCWRASSIENVQSRYPRKGYRVLLPPAAAQDPVKEDAGIPPEAKFRASLLLRVLPPPALAAGTGERRISDVASRSVFLDTVATLNLPARWSTDASGAANKLSSMTRVVVSYDSPLTGTLFVSSPDRNEAAEIADALVSAFKSILEKSQTDQTSRLARPVYEQIKTLTDSVEQARNQMLDCMNNRQIVDYAFLDALNGRPGMIRPELDASLNPNIKLAWFSHQLESLKSIPKDQAPGYLAGAVLPFDHPVMKLCQSWLDLAPTAASVAESSDRSLSGVFDYKRDETEAAVEVYKSDLQKWITKTEQDLPPEDAHSLPAPGTDRLRQEEYRRVKQRYEAGTESLKALQENASRLFGSDAPLYVPPVLVLKRSVEPVRR
jgi:hypothetical protein